MSHSPRSVRAAGRALAVAALSALLLDAAPPPAQAEVRPDQPLGGLSIPGTELPTAAPTATDTGDGGGRGPTAGSAGIEWVSIPGGSYQMGSTDGEPDEQPAHLVTLAGFQMARTELTVAQYRACVEAGACSAPDTGGSCNWGRSDREQHPVNCLDWDQAQAFARWAGGGARLCREAEWEYVARGRNARRYPWGEDAPGPGTPRYGNFADVSAKRANPSWTIVAGYDDGFAQTSPVCSFPAGNSSDQVCDLAGNVWEWGEDRYHDSYVGAPDDGSAWLAPAGSGRVSRGGCWDSLAGRLRAANRDWLQPGYRDVVLGARLCRSAP